MRHKKELSDLQNCMAEVSDWCETTGESFWVLDEPKDVEAALDAAWKLMAKLEEDEIDEEMGVLAPNDEIDQERK